MSKPQSMNPHAKFKSAVSRRFYNNAADLITVLFAQVVYHGKNNA